MPIVPKTVNKLTGKFYRVNNYTIPSVGCGFSDSALSTAVNNILTNIVDPLGNNLSNNASGSNSVMGVPCLFDLALELRSHATQDPILDPVGESEVVQILSHTSYAAGLSTVTGIAIEFMSNACPVDAINNIIRYNSTTFALEYSSTAGSSWGSPVVVSSLITNDCVILKNASSSAYIFVRRTAAILPISDVQDVLTSSGTNWAIGLSSWVNGGRKPFYNTQLISIDFLIPVVAHWSSVSPSDELLDMGVGFLDIGIRPDDRYVVEVLISTVPNTLPDLAFLPTNASHVQIVACGGAFLNYGAAGSRDFYLTGRTIILVPAHIGFNIEISDSVTVSYWRI